MSQTVIGIFEHSTEAQNAKAYLLANGFSSDEVDINTSGGSGADSTYRNTTTGTANEEGVGDRISNFFKNLFTNDDEAESHISAAQKGTVVTVHAQTSDKAATAAEILNNYGAMDVNDFSKQSMTDSGSGDLASGYPASDNTSSDTGLRDADSGNTIKVIKEELQVGKREVETGGVRLRSRIVERPVEESIRLREERVNLERTAVDRPATEADFTNFKEGTIEVTEYAERPVVAKTARVTEEVSLGKEVTEREETISDTVRHTEVDAEKIASTERESDKNNF